VTEESYPRDFNTSYAASYFLGEWSYLDRNLISLFCRPTGDEVPTLGGGEEERAGDIIRLAEDSWLK